jgi:hypothetical protein
MLTVLLVVLTLLLVVLGLPVAALATLELAARYQRRRNSPTVAHRGPRSAQADRAPTSSTPPQAYAFLMAQWKPEPEHTVAWSAAGGVLLAVGAAATVTLSVQDSSSYVSPPLIGICAALALIGLYWMLAPLMHWWPWRRRERPRTVGMAMSPLQPPAPQPEPVKRRPMTHSEMRLAAAKRAQPAARPGDALLKAMGQHPEQRKQREHAVKRGNDLLRMIFEAEVRDLPSAKAREIVYFNLAARVEAWARGIGSDEEVQRASGNPGADLARLKLLVQTQVEGLRALQERAPSF